MDVQESVEEQVVFFQSVYQKFLEAKTSIGEIDYYYGICGTTVRLLFAGDALVPHLTPALSHLQLPPVETPNLTICLWDSRSTNSTMVPPPWKRDRHTYRGDIWGYNSSRIKTAFHWIEFSLNMMDLETNTGIFWVEHAQSLPFWVKASPLRTLLHWWMEKNICQLVHAGAVGTKDGAVLLTGKGGVGKSTTALSCLRSGLFYLGDDFVVTRVKPEPVVYSLYNTAKLDADHVKNFPEFSGLISNPEDLNEEKAVMFLNPQYSKQINLAMPLKAILVPIITNGRESRIAKTSSKNILRAASFITMSTLPGAGVQTYEFLNELSESLPCFQLELGSDLTSIPRTISMILDNLHYENIDNIYKIRPDSTEFTHARKSYPYVSVIIPVYNGERFIQEAIESVMSQNYPSLEIIIVNDGSTDRTEDIIEQLPIEIRYFKQENSGPSAARNKGIKESSGEYITFLDVDDLWPKNNLHILTRELSQNQDIDVIHGYAQLAQYNPSTSRYEYYGNPTESFPSYIGAAIYRKSVFTKVGLFDPTLLYGEDVDWFKRAKEQNVNIKRLDDITLIVRRHGRNMTRDRNQVELNTLRVFKKVLDRMRSHE